MESIYNVFYNLSSTTLKHAVVVYLIQNATKYTVNKNYNKIKRKSCLAEISTVLFL